LKNNLKITLNFCFKNREISIDFMWKPGVCFGNIFYNKLIKIILIQEIVSKGIKSKII